MKPTDLPLFISELGAGVLEEKMAHVVSEVAGSVVHEDKSGEVVLKLKMKRVGSTDQVKVEHTLSYKRPKKRGTIAEDDTQESVMYVNEGGNVTQFPEHQTDMFQAKGATANAD